MTAVRRVLAMHIGQIMTEQSLTKSELAALDRLLVPDNDSVSTRTMVCVAKVLGKTLRASLS